MDTERAKERLDAYELHLFGYSHALSVMGMDGVTAAPPESHVPRGVSMGILSREMQRYARAPENEVLIRELYEHREDLDPELARRAELLYKEQRDRNAVPEEELIAYRQLLNEAGYVWRKAKAADDFPSFAPYVDRIVETQKRFAELRHPGKDPYDVQLDSFEEGTSRAYYDAFFAEVRDALVPLIREVGKAPQPDDGWLRVRYPIEQQRKLSLLLMDAFCLDRERCSLAETEHPLTGGSSVNDVRISTHYYENDPVASMYSVIHEGGHANYHLHVDPAYDYNCLGGGASSGVHESQSRFWENYAGRSREFIGWLWPRFRELFPSQCEGHDAEDFYRCVNISRPSLIRTQADELTYCLHVIIRYELEKRMFDGSLKTADVPAEWNRLYREYLGVEVPDDSRGVLQDVHWSMGYFGYFPTYSLGTAYGAQILDALKKDLPFGDLLSRGETRPILDWLSERIYRFGRLYAPDTVVPRVTGEPFRASHYVRYLTEKYRELYGL